MIQELLNNRYLLLRKLGSGGFGETFLAEDTNMPSKRRCVIKQLKLIENKPEVYQLVKERFAREAVVLEELGDGNQQIPKLYAYFTIDDQFYLVQEWIAGETLGKKLQLEGAQSESFVREFMLDILPVLDYVHSKRMVHRDIKPDNIIIRQTDGKPVLIDFGAVKEMMGTIINSHGSTTSSIVIGTSGFMPAEQAAGRPVYASDLYSLGMTAIYLLTRRSPKILDIDHQTGEILWQKYAVNISPRLVAVLNKAVQSHWRDRYQTAKEMLAALELDTTIIPSTVTLLATNSPKKTDETQEQNTAPIEQINQKNLLIIGSMIIMTLVSIPIIYKAFFNPIPQSNLKQSIAVTPKINFPKNYDFTWISQRQVTDADLFDKNALELDVLRNSIYARYGRRFRSQELQKYFSSQSWYRPIYSPESFPDNLLTPLEQKNVAYILEYQERNGLRWVR
ncbi:protein kinase domain-containing protein [Floridanema aerugineum]|uniref:non-specific serine/threonine protein kinase n=1 Tax=Floridaenema aerugineum BLCC-F46 TaxID=3153654 RepID=A0ABV4XD95_9CYAN